MGAISVHGTRGESQLTRAIALAILLSLVIGFAPAVTPQDIDAAVQKGTIFLKKRYRNGVGAERDGNGIGPPALAGLALLECGTPVDDPTVRNITAAVRDASFTETRTYQISLCLLYLDRLGDPADEPLIQLLAVRLLAGQNAQGGWTYDCIDEVPREVEKRLRTWLVAENQLVGERGPNPFTQPGAAVPAAKDRPPGPAAAGRLHAEVQKYAATLPARGTKDHRDDNSNTQFGVLAVWAARKHGVPVEAALNRIEQRFLATQNPQTGGWPYGGRGGDGSPSMTCAGLLGLATALARREERALVAEASKPAPVNSAPKPGDPSFTPLPPENPAAKKARPLDARDAAVQRGLADLAVALRGGAAPKGPGKGRGNEVRLFDGQLGGRDYYFLWSVERVGVVYGLEKIGGVDWYAAGATALVPAQNSDGSWGGKGGDGPEVDTAFALLFLSRSNVVRDLSSLVQKTTSDNELRATIGPGGGVNPSTDEMPPTADVPPPSTVPMPRPTVTIPVEDESRKLAGELLLAPPADWNRKLEKVRDAKGGDYTRALVLAIGRLEGERKKEAREALAERLTRMTPETLREMMKADDAELRRGAVLAAAMKDDQAHVPDLIGRLSDDEELVVRAARAGLKSLSGGQDFGPQPGASKAEREAAAKAWKQWWDAQK